MNADARDRLARVQRRFVAALVQEAQVPAGFDSRRLEITAAALRRKRSRAVARSWPALTRSLGEGFEGSFREFALQQALRPDMDSLADGHAFARFLARKGRLPTEARREVAAFDLRYAVVRGRTVQRSWPSAIAWLRVIALQLAARLEHRLRPGSQRLS